MQKNVLERIVLVKFKNNISDEVLQGYYEGINKLKKITAGLESFQLHNFFCAGNENKLGGAVSNVLFPDVMTVWHFEDIASLEAFINSTEHYEIAKRYFKPAIEQRVVFNRNFDYTSISASNNSREVLAS